VPRYGFNFQWLFDDALAPVEADQDALDFLVTHGFDFVRVATNYMMWTDGTDYLHPREDEINLIDGYIAESSRRGLHLSLNLHRAPGYCINGGDRETHNLWTDTVAQDAFVFLWERWADRYADVAPELLSFDLLNEPPALDLRGFTRDIHESLMRRTIDAIRAIDPHRPIVLDGLDGGNMAMPELADVGAAHSTRGYQPYPVSHWGAEWWDGWKAGDAPKYPGVNFEGRSWTRQDIVDVYEPWRAVEAAGTEIHVGEFGCYEHTPNADAIRWLTDLIGIFHEFGWGYALWNFDGPFGIMGHDRPGATFVEMDGYPAVDIEVLELLKSRPAGSTAEST